jgi:tetratricopeptide (TPR) repeat protein
LLLLAAAAPLLLFAPILDHGFLLDDYVLFRTSPSLQDLGSIGQGFVRDVGAVRKGGDTVGSSYYRPIFLALSTLYHQAVGGEPRPWHAASLVLAAAIGALFCAWLLKLGLPPPLAVLTAVVFSLHPSHVSSVAWASGLQELLAAIFVGVALLAAGWRLEREGDAVPLAVACGAYAAALLSKEVAIALLPFVAVWAWVASAEEPRRGRRLRRLAVALAAVTAAYLVVRVLVLDGLAHPSPGAPPLGNALTAVPLALATYLRLLLAPVGFSILRPERPVHALLDPPIVVSLLVLLAVAALAIWAVRRRRELALPIAWLLAWLLPVLNVWALDPQWLVTDRYLFLPALALPWLVARTLPRRAALVLLAVLAVVYAGLSFRYLRIFASERAFVAAMERAEPTSPLVFAEKGRLLLQQGRRVSAREALLRAVELDPLAAGALVNLGDLELERGDLAAAERRYREVLAVRPYASRGFKLLVLALSRRGRRDEAVALAAETAGRWGEDFEAQLLHALLLATTGQRAAAEQAFAAARRLRPDDPGVAGGLDAALARTLPTLQGPAPPEPLR